MTVVIACLSAACDGSDDTSSAAGDGGTAGGGQVLEACDVEAPTSCPDPAPTYSDDIAPIIEARCVICHNGAGASPWPLTSYGHVRDWKNEIRGALLNCTMPPPAERVPITNAERLEILTWIRCDTPE